MEQFDIAIIGSGPSGATAAFKLADQGYAVVIIEKEHLPRYKTCGGGLVFRGRQMLPFDLESCIDREFTAIDVYFSGQDLHLRSTKETPTVSMVMRDQFDLKIVQEAQKKGIKLLENHKVTKLDFGGEYIAITTSQGQIQARFIIAADGALGQTAKLAGWKEDTRYLVPALEYEVEVDEKTFKRLKDEARFDVDFVPKGYAWNFPKKKHLSIGVVSMKRTKIDLKQTYREYLELLDIKPENILVEEAHGYQIPVAMRKDGFVKNNVFLIGDAAGFADPLTAEGISNAIYSGILAAEALSESKLDPVLAEKLYLEKLEQKLLPELKTAEFLASLFYNQTKIRNYFIRKSGKRFSDYLTDVFTGEKSYPKNLAKLVRRKIRESVFG